MRDAGEERGVSGRLDVCDGVSGASDGDACTRRVGDPLDASALGRFDEGALDLGAIALDADGHEQHGLDALERRSHRNGVVVRRDVDGRVRQRGRLGRVADEQAQLYASLRQIARDSAAELARGAGDRDRSGHGDQAEREARCGEERQSTR